MVFVCVHKCVYFTVRRPEIERAPEIDTYLTLKRLLDTRYFSVVCMLASFHRKFIRIEKNELDDCERNENKKIKQTNSNPLSV